MGGFPFPGFVYGAKDNSRLQLFIDDINLPNPDSHGVQHYNEVSGVRMHRHTVYVLSWGVNANCANLTVTRLI